MIHIHRNVLSIYPVIIHFFYVTISKLKPPHVIFKPVYTNAFKSNRRQIFLKNITVLCYHKVMLKLTRGYDTFFIEFPVTINEKTPLISGIMLHV